MSQSLFTVFEDRQKKLVLTSRQVDDILSFRSILGENRLSLSFDGIIHVRHFVGFISKGKTRLQILPKIYENAKLDEEAEQRESMRAMMNLLRISEFNKLLALPDQSSFAEQADIMEILITIFASKVFDAYSRQMNREYISISENSNYVKGRIDFSANLRENPIRKDLHIVSYQSFEHDNLINNVVKTVCIKLIRLTRDADNKKNLKKALVFLDDAQEILLSKDVFDSAKFNRLNMPFKAVFDMAKMFFYNLTPQSYQGDDTVCSFLIPLNELFEYYLFKLFDAFKDGTSASYRNSRSFGRGVGNGFQSTVRPDVILSKGQNAFMIADAKYKNPMYRNGIYSNISHTDIYQVFAYAKTYDVDTVALIYPQFEDHDTPSIMIEIGSSDRKVLLIIGCVDIRDASIEKNSSYLRESLSSYAITPSNR